MEGIIEGLLYVQGDLGLTINQIEDILEIPEEEAKRLVLNLKNYYEENNRGLRINYLGNTIKLRGVDSTYVLRRLLAKGLIKECGKSDLPGRPILYKTTDDFLDYFGLASIKDLPNIELLEEDNSPKDLYTSIYKEGDNDGRENNN